MSVPIDGSPSPSRPRGRRWGPFVLIALGLLILVGTLLWAGLDNLSRDPASLAIPTRVGGLPLQVHLSGSEAADQIRQLHRSRFPMTGAAVAMYGNRSAMLWVARTWGSWGARLMRFWMTQAIARSDTPFTPVGQRRLYGVTVYELTGMGKSHFYFQVDDRLYWLAVAPDHAEQGLEELLDFALGVARREPAASTSIPKER